MHPWIILRGCVAAQTNPSEKPVRQNRQTKPTDKPDRQSCQTFLSEKPVRYVRYTCRQTHLVHAHLNSFAQRRLLNHYWRLENISNISKEDKLIQLTFTDGASSVLRVPALHLLSVMFNVAFNAIGRVADVAGDALRALPVSVATSALTKARPTVQRGKWPSFGENFWPKLL